MKKIGITGGIGSGKSTISNYFKKKGYMVHDSDSVVAELYEKPNRFFLDLLKSFKTINIVKKNKIDKAVIAKNLFVNKALKNKIYSKHPEVSGVKTGMQAKTKCPLKREVVSSLSRYNTCNNHKGGNKRFSHKRTMSLCLWR